MSTIVTRSGKGSPLTHNEVDTNFTNLNTDKVEKTAADITGGTINNTTIGATTPSTGVFTTLTATTAGTTTAKVWSNTGTTPIADLELQRGTTSTWGGDAFTDYRIRASGGNFILQSQNNTTAVLDLLTVDEANNAIKFSPVGVEQMRVTRTASAVNYVQVTGAATGAPSQPIISAQGSDANINIALQGKGTGAAVLLDSGGGSTLQAIPRATGGDTFLSVQRNVGAVVLSAASGVSNGNLVLQPKGTGALQAQQTDSTATGGNARGANAVDWQTTRDVAARVASGGGSVVSGGYANTASIAYSVASGGFNNTAGYLSSVVGGQSNSASGTGHSAIVGGFANTASGYYNFVGGGANNSGTSSSVVTTQSATMNGTTAVTLSGSNANIKVGQFISGTSIADRTYVAAISGTSLTLSQAASGSSTSTLNFYTPHGVVVGGGNNQATGSYSFIGGGGDAGTAANRNVASGDWSFVGGGRSNTASAQGAVVCGGGIYAGVTFANTASGQTSFLGGGLSNTASGQGSVVSGGYANTVSGTYSSIVGGSYGTTRGLEGYTTFPAGNALLGTIGGAQASLLILAVQTTDATATVLRSSGAAASTTNQVILPNNSAYYFRGEVVSGVTGGGNTKGWFIEGVIKRGANAASTALVGTPTVTSSYADAGASTWTIAVTADTTNGGLAVTFTGQAGTTIRTVCRLNTTEMTY